MRPIINAVESLWVNRVALAARLFTSGVPNEQTFSGAVDMSQRCQEPTSALGQPVSAIGQLAAIERSQSR